MLTLFQQDPVWISTILHWPWVWFFARLALTSAYLLGGVTKLLNFPAAVAEQERFGMHPAWLWAILAILIELGGSALILSGTLVWLGAGALGCLTAIAMLKADNFWTKSGNERLVQANTFFEHLGLIGGLVLVSIIFAVQR
jgi:uncharacterized membrane protein YphA (DoxX/SURF4 family)